MLEAINLVIQENNFKDFQKRKLKKKLENLYRCKPEKLMERVDAVWAWRICAANLMLGDLSFFGWECRSRWAWDLANKGWIYPKWDGKPCRLYVLAEQGIGDEIRTPKTEDEQRGDYDAFIPAGDVFKHYRKNRKPPKVPYLTADPEKVEYYKSVLPENCVGVSWKGRLADLDLSDLLVNHDHYINLQYNDIDDRLLEIEQPTYDDTFALVKAIGKLYSTTTSISHVGGALGVETHVIKPPKIFQRELNNLLPWRYPYGSKSHWYESQIIYQNAKEWKRSLSGMAHRSSAVA